MTRRRRSVATAVAVGLGALMLSLGITGPASADDPGPPIPPKTCPQETPGLTQIAWPEGATPPILPYGQFHKMTNEYADRGLVFTENDADMSSAYKRYNPVSGTYNTVHMGTFGNLYRANFLNSDVRRVTFKLDDTNMSATIHRLSAFSASGSRLAQVEYRDWQAKPGPYNNHEDHSFTMTVNSASTPIKSVVYTQLTSNGQRHAFSASTWCVQYGTPAPPPPPPPPPPAPACPAKSVTANADAWFEQGSTSNKGDDSSLSVQSKQGQAARSVVRFPAAALPAGCVLDKAELRLYAESVSSGRTIDVQPLAGPWQEMAVNWSTQPATTGAVASTGSGSDEGWRTWQVTEQVAGMLASGTSHGFVIRDRDEGQDATQKFNSRESSSNRPALVLTLREGTPTTPPPTDPPPPPPPAPTCTSQSVTAAADAWFEQGSTSNKGDDSALAVQSKSGQAFRALVRFALPAAPAGCALDRAELRLYADSVKPDRTIQVQAVTSAWQELGVTWDTQPATTGPVASTASGTDKGWRTWDVTQLVGGAQHGFVIRDADENGDAEQKFNSREKGTDVPTLVLTYRAQ